MVAQGTAHWLCRLPPQPVTQVCDVLPVRMVDTLGQIVVVATFLLLGTPVYVWHERAAWHRRQQRHKTKKG
jgi:hypothetical protein